VPLVVVLDACVLHPAPLRDLLIRLDLAGMVRARWSERIMEECASRAFALGVRTSRRTRSTEPAS
jgi:hypothetical protein